MILFLQLMGGFLFIGMVIYRGLRNGGIYRKTNIKTRREIDNGRTKKSRGTCNKAWY